MALLSRYLARQRYSKIAPHLKGDVLDLGCSKAEIFEEYGSQMSSYSGIERSALLVERLNVKYPDKIFVQRDLDSERIEIQKKFDCVLMVAVIEHLFNQKFVMDEIKQTLKPGGIVVITTPTPIGNDLIHRVGASLGFFAKSAVDDHIVIYNRHRFKILADEVGLELAHHQYFQLYCNQLAILKKVDGK